MTKLLVIAGSLRKDASSKAVARHLVSFIGDRADCTMPDIGALPHYNADITDDENVETFKAQILGCDGLIFVTPEYNYGVPGVLKNAIDWASRPAFQSVFVGKHALVVSVSGGLLGGARAQGQLKYALTGMLVNVFLCPEIVIPQAPKKMVDGEFTWPDGEAFIHDKVDAFLQSIDKQE